MHGGMRKNRSNGLEERSLSRFGRRRRAARLLLRRAREVAIAYVPARRRRPTRRGGEGLQPLTPRRGGGGEAVQPRTPRGWGVGAARVELLVAGDQVRSVRLEPLEEDPAHL